MICHATVAESRTIRFSPQQSSRFSRMLESAIQRQSGQWGERNLRTLQDRIEDGQTDTEKVELALSLEEAFDLVQSLAESLYEDDWPAHDRHVYDELLGQLARDPFA